MDNLPVASSSSMQIKKLQSKNLYFIRRRRRRKKVKECEGKDDNEMKQRGIPGGRQLEINQVFSYFHFKYWKKKVKLRKTFLRKGIFAQFVVGQSQHRIYRWKANLSEFHWWSVYRNNSKSKDTECLCKISYHMKWKHAKQSQNLRADRLLADRRRKKLDKPADNKLIDYVKIKLFPKKMLHL